MRKSPLLLIVITILTAIITGCSNNGDGIGGSGLMEADESIVSAEASGRANVLNFDEGSLIKIGDTLVVIDPSRLQLELASAKAGRTVAVAQLKSATLQLSKAREAEAFAQQERDRFAKLLKSGTTTEKQLDQLEFEYTQAIIARETAEAAIATIKAEIEKIDADLDRIVRQIQDCYPLSPIDGTVTERYIEPGELLSVGKPIAKISNLSSLWVKVYLSAGSFANVKIGDNATVDTEAGGEVYRGRVVWTSEEAEFTPKNVQTRESRTDLVYAVKVQVDNTDGKLKIGMPVFVTIGE